MPHSRNITDITSLYKDLDYLIPNFTLNPFPNSDGVLSVNTENGARQDRSHPNFLEYVTWSFSAHHVKVHAHQMLDPEKHCDIHETGGSLQQLTTTIEDIIDFEANSEAVRKSPQQDLDFGRMTKTLTDAWCQSFHDIEHVLVCMLALFGVTLNKWEDDTGRSYYQRILEQFDVDSHPLNQVLGHRKPVDEVYWSDTWKEALAGESTISRNLTRDSIESLGMFQGWWPTAQSLNHSSPEFLGSRIEPPKNYEVWFTPVLKDLVSAFEICHKAEVKKIDDATAANREALNRKSKATLTTVKGTAASSTTNGHVAGSNISLSEHSKPEASTSFVAPRSASHESSSIREENVKLKHDLAQAIIERDRAREDQSRLRQQRDEAQEEVAEFRKQLSDQHDAQSNRAMMAMEDTADEVWSQVRSGLQSDLLFEYLRSMSHH